LDVVVLAGLAEAPIAGVGLGLAVAVDDEPAVAALLVGGEMPVERATRHTSTAMNPFAVRPDKLSVSSP
jgi:hypothetical protein